MQLKQLPYVLNESRQWRGKMKNQDFMTEKIEDPESSRFGKKRPRKDKETKEEKIWRQ